jgi:hypothetical protein
MFLSHGRATVPLVLLWEWDRPKIVVTHWTGTVYEVIATSQVEEERSLLELRHVRSACDYRMRANWAWGRLLPGKLALYLPNSALCLHPAADFLIHHGPGGSRARRDGSAEPRL